MITICLDSMGYDHKPVAEEVASISMRIGQLVAKVDANQLAKAIQQGQTYTPAIFKKCAQRGVRSRKEGLFESSQMISLDFDAGLPSTLRQPTILYTSFSHTKDKPKYRAIWFLNEVVTGADEYKALIKGLAAETGYADPSCTHLCRLFYGSRPGSVIELNPELTLDISTIRQPKISKSIRPTTWADGETEAEQREILFKLKPVHRKWLIGLVRSELDKLKTFDGSSGSRYQTLWSTVANLACIPELLPNVIAQWVTQAVENNEYFTNGWDKSVDDTVESAITWAKLKRES